MLDLLFVPVLDGLKDSFSVGLRGGVYYGLKNSKLLPYGCAGTYGRINDSLLAALTLGYFYPSPVFSLAFGKNGFLATQNYCGVLGIIYKENEVFYQGYESVSFALPVVSLKVKQSSGLYIPVLSSSTPLSVKSSLSFIYSFGKVPLVAGSRFGGKFSPRFEPIWYASLWGEYLVASVPLVIGLQGDFVFSKDDFFAGGSLGISYRGWQWGRFSRAPSVKIHIDRTRSFSWKEFPIKLRVRGDVAYWQVEVRAGNTTVLKRDGNSTFDGTILVDLSSVRERIIGKDVDAVVFVKATSRNGEETLKKLSFSLAYVEPRKIRLDRETVESMSSNQAFIEFLVSSAGKGVKVYAYWKAEKKLEDALKNAEALARTFTEALVSSGVKKDLISVKIMGPQKLPFPEESDKNEFLEIKFGG